ncbi:hypothetical protein D0T50_01815 [Bacteroides sp. 214]|uniref:BF3164 family lipoprotein n=1 Tax=Bacteroides sp. 214 TaxID=2302935 RepID=UPI0013D3FC6C|nr:BF3164 family lipoprotein [Bacteroides sp. 214]NDW11623.1 hypothetical protein [Bacteroides sp. 214]
MNTKPIYALLLCILASCQSSRTTDIERVSVTPEIVVNDLETPMPGQLQVTENYLLWTDPFSSEFGVHLLERETGKELSAVAPIGNGPEEFLSPTVSTVSGDSFLTYDYNANRFFLGSGDKSTWEKLDWDIKHLVEVTRITPLNKEQFVAFSPSQNPSFALLDHEGKVLNRFGKAPIEEEVSNSFAAFQGGVTYHPIREILVYSLFNFPYIASYKKGKGVFALQHEFKEGANCHIVEGKLKYDRSKKGISELALTKDYIVTLERDYQTDPMDESTVGRDFSKLPQTVFLYDYNLILKKIVHTGMPILRIAATPLTNEVYAVGVNPDFAIVKFNL